MVLFQWLIFSVSAALQVCVIAALRRRAYKEFPFVYAYSLVLFLKVLVDAALFTGVVSFSHNAKIVYYYRSDAVREFLLFAVVVSLIEGAMQGSPYRGRVRVLLAVTAVVSVFVSLMVHWKPVSQFALMMTEVTRDLSFGSVVLTLLLWLMLISSPRRKPQLLMLTVGLGLQFTGEAIGQSLRQIAHSHRSTGLVFAGNLLLSVSHLMRLYVWWEAFRRPYAELDKPEAGGESQALPRQAETLFQSNG